ncbi:MAG: hypothetical protein Q7U76_13145 [Nitrospirota bacterium]|nr:hypothetical protein [Nitrospirota bacterium]
MTLEIADMGLGPLAEHGAMLLRSELGPEVIKFRRGYRDLKTQAHDMAGNIVRNKEWIKQTYTRQDRPSYAVACRLQDVVYQHSEVTESAEIERYLYEAMLQMPDAHEISFHIKTRNGKPAAEAFDLTPLEDSRGTLTATGIHVKNRILKLPYLDAFLLREGGLRIWHLQFLLKSVTA